MTWTSAKRGLLLGLALLPGCHQHASGPEAALPAVSAPPPAPASAALYTEAGAIRALSFGPGGTLWAATAGGALRWSLGHTQPSRWAAADGLAGSDVRSIQPLETGALAVTPTRLCRLGGAGRDKADDSTALGELRGLVRDGRGTLWLASSRGVFRRTGTVWRLAYPGEAWRLASDGVYAWAATAGGLRRLGGGRPVPLPVAQNELGTVTALAAGPRNVTLASASGTWRWDGHRWHELALPPGSPASHVSALCVRGGVVYAGLYGDGVYRLQPSGWERLPGEPAQTKEVTALAALPSGLAVGTRNDGVWDDAGGRWSARALPAALPSGDVYGLIGYRGALWASTFDSGLLKMDAQGQTAVTRADGLRSASPRALVVFGDRLYVRHTTGQIDATGDGRVWRPAFTAKDLPRSLTSALSTDGERLYVGGWAGWSAWDGKVWVHHDHDPELAHQVVTAISARPGEVWIGTQKQGLFVYANGRYTHLYETQGLTDDWITCLSVTPRRILIGTYTGGLLQWDGRRFAVLLKPGTYAIRAVCLRPGDGRALAATPLGVYEEGAGGWHRLDSRLGGSETQALLPGPMGLWVGSRTGLAFVPTGLLLPPS